MTDDKSNKLAALRERVRAKVADSRLKSMRREKALEEVNDGDDDVIEIMVEPRKLLHTNLDFEVDETYHLRKIASTLILIGSILGMVTGGLILQGNPSDLLTSPLFSNSESVDVHGFIIDESGEFVINATIQLIELSDDVVIQETISDDNGRFLLDGVIVKRSLIRVSKEGHITVERTFVPQEIGVDAITLNSGEGIREEDDDSLTQGWSLEAAVSLSTIIGLFTLGTSLIGVHASIEAVRGKRYRRTQYLAGIGIFSRGLIVFGPILILCGMGLLILSRDGFDDRMDN
ncbi:MAG: carboxypeptidase-like regulatory domain-containing protein [Candidatus Poseidoniales archaeon]